MKLEKKIILGLIVLLAIVLIPRIADAATGEYTYSDTEQGIEWAYELDENGNVVNLRCKTTTVLGAVTIPSAIEEKTVIELADDDWDTGAFENCQGITEVSIPNTIAKIGVSAFENCTGLSTITIPDSVTSIGNYAFKGCSGLESIQLSSNLSTIGNNAFENSGLETITIPNSVTSIGENAFAYCSSLKEVNLSERLSKISGGCFKECVSLKSIILPDSITTIEDGGILTYGAFKDCTNLEKILIPDSVVSIDDDVFEGCDKLTIYGNEGMTSKEYAETNNINFKYISEWDDSELGDDITSPIVEKMRVPYSSVVDYESQSNLCYMPAGSVVTIEVYFSESIHGETAPTLTIKCGTGENIALSNGVINGQKVIYTYTITEQDVGIIAPVDLSGGDLKDGAGNVAVLSWPELKIDLTNDYVYANGTVNDTNPTPGTNPDDGEDNPDDGEDAPNDGKDDTVIKDDKLPNTGEGILLMVILAAIGAGIVLFKKNRDYKEIK